MVIRPRQPDGTMPDLAGAVMELRINTGAACLPIRGAVTAEGFELDLGGLELPAKLLKCAIWIDWGQGLTWQADLSLNVSRGC